MAKNDPNWPIIKDAAKNSVAPRKRSVTYQDVLRVLIRDELRSMVLARYRELGGNPDRFAAEVGQRRLMGAAMTLGEDWMEYHHPRWEVERIACKEIRRRLEA